MFGIYGPLQSNEQAYACGFDSGLNWPDKWNHWPGGPWVCRDPFNTNNKDWVAYCAHTKKNNEEWMRGWVDGIKKQNPNHPLLKVK